MRRWNGIAQERADLQELISDISHQVKTPIATSTCPNCRVAKKILEGREFEIIDAEKNPEMVKEFGIMQAPTLVITDGEHMTKYVNTSNIKKYVDEGL